MFIGIDELGFVGNGIEMAGSGTVVVEIDRRSARLAGFVTFVAEVATQTP